MQLELTIVQMSFSFYLNCSWPFPRWWWGSPSAESKCPSWQPRPPYPYPWPHYWENSRGPWAQRLCFTRCWQPLNQTWWPCCHTCACSCKPSGQCVGPSPQPAVPTSGWWMRPTTADDNGGTVLKCLLFLGWWFQQRLAFKLQKDLLLIDKI